MSTSIQSGEPGQLTKHRVLFLLEQQLGGSGPVDRRGDTLYFSDVECLGDVLCGALVVDSVVDLFSRPGMGLAVSRVFGVTPTPAGSGQRGEAVTDLGTGRGYQVQLALAHFEQDSLSVWTLSHLELNLGTYGEGFVLPDWTVHEFDELDTGNWGAFVLLDHSSRGGFGHQDLVVIDLGGWNHHEVTMRLGMTTESVRFEDLSRPLLSDTRAALDAWSMEGYDLTSHFARCPTCLERHLEGHMAWRFEGRTLVVEEHRAYQFREKWWDGQDEQLLAYDHVLPVKTTRFMQRHWPPVYIRVDSADHSGWETP